MEYSNLLFTSITFLVFLTSFLILRVHFHRNMGGYPSVLPRNWPVFGMIPSLLSNLHRLGSYGVEVLQECHGTLAVKGPWFTEMEFLVTADPVNVQYVMSKNHHCFNRGHNFEQIFETLGDGIINSDGEKWKYQRKIALTYFTSIRFQRFMAKTISYKVERGLIPLLERSSTEGHYVDLQDIFKRLAEDITFMFLADHDPNYLSFENDQPSLTHLIRDLSVEGEEALLTRHVLPSCIWKLLRRLRIGKERKVKEFEESMDSFIYGFIRSKREDIMKRSKESTSMGDIHGDDMLSVYMEENYGKQNHGFKSVDVFLRDTFTNFFLAGQETVSVTLSWFFWLITKHPRVEAKIIEELRDENIGMECDTSQLNSPNMLVYLHAALYETLRLYPPVPYIHRSPNKSETLASGHQVKPGTMIILCAYTMGRMKWIWGDDCEEFKPERWITTQGTIKHEPSYKFLAFNTGPRVCLGKEIAMLQMKAVVCTVLRHNYRFELVEGHQAEPAASMVLRMKHGLKVRVKKYL